MDAVLHGQETGRAGFDEAELDRALTRILEQGRLLLGGVELSVTLLSGPDADTPVCAGTLASLLDMWQYRQGQGPCLDAAACAATLTVADLRRDTRWPAWTPRAVEAGILSCLSVGLRAPIAGAVNAYARRPGMGDGDTLMIAQALAGSVTVLLASVPADAAVALPQHRRAAGQHRAVINRAEQILMSQCRCSRVDAFGMLARHAEAIDRPLADAAAVVLRGTSCQGVTRSR